MKMKNDNDDRIWRKYQTYTVVAALIVALVLFIGGNCSKPLLKNPAVQLLHERMQQHPKPEIHEGLMNNLQNKNIQFVLVEQSEMPIEFQIIPKPDGSKVGILAIQEEKLLSIQNTPCFIDEILYHEYIHFLQWRIGEFPVETFFPETIIASVNADQAINVYFSEVDAFVDECELAAETKCYEEPLCGIYVHGGLQKMKEKLAGQMSQLPLYKPFEHILKQCASAPSTNNTSPSDDTHQDTTPQLKKHHKQAGFVPSLNPHTDATMGDKLKVA